jgi:hypothetical protein
MPVSELPRTVLRDGVVRWLMGSRHVSVRRTRSMDYKYPPESRQCPPPYYPRSLAWADPEARWRTPLATEHASRQAS